MTETMAPTEVRIDKWLWCVRAYKTRALATEACRHERVSVDGQVARPARNVAPGQTIALRLGGWTRSLRVVALLDRRVGPALVPQYAEDVTPAEERAKAQERTVQNLLARPTGEGRPTKKDRRAWDRAFLGPLA